MQQHWFEITCGMCYTGLRLLCVYDTLVCAITLWYTGLFNFWFEITCESVIHWFMLISCDTLVWDYFVSMIHWFMQKLWQLSVVYWDYFWFFFLSYCSCLYFIGLKLVVFFLGLYFFFLSYCSCLYIIGL